MGHYHLSIIAFLRPKGKGFLPIYIVQIFIFFQSMYNLVAMGTGWFGRTARNDDKKRVLHGKLSSLNTARMFLALFALKKQVTGKLEALTIRSRPPSALDLNIVTMITSCQAFVHYSPSFREEPKKDLLMGPIPEQIFFSCGLVEFAVLEFVGRFLLSMIWKRLRRMTTVFESYWVSFSKKVTATAPGPTCVPIVQPTVAMGRWSVCPCQSSALSVMYFCRNWSDRPL